MKITNQEIVNTDFKKWYLVLTTYKTLVIIVDFELSPLDDNNEKDDLIYFDKESIESKKNFLI